jgi:hypothetical protein
MKSAINVAFGRDFDEVNCFYMGVLCVSVLKKIVCL